MTASVVVLVIASLILAAVANCADSWQRINQDINDLTDPDRHRAAWGELNKEPDA